MANQESEKSGTKTATASLLGENVTSAKRPDRTWRIDYSMAPSIGVIYIDLRHQFRRGTPSQDVAEALYDAYYNSTYRQVVAAFGDPDLAEEATQEAFARALERYSSLRDRSKFSPWVASIALNVARDSVRRRKQERPTGECAASVASEHDTAAEALRCEERGRLLSALSELPEDFRTATVLFYVHGLGVKAVSEMLGVAEGTVKSRLSRARLLLKKTLLGETVIAEDGDRHGH